MTNLTSGMEHIGTIIARMSEDVARRQARWLIHEQHCDYWRSLVPAVCNCDARPVVDLLLAIAQRRRAAA